MGVYVNSPVVTLGSTLYTMAGYDVGSGPETPSKPRTSFTNASKNSTNFTQVSKVTTDYVESI